VGHGGAPLPSLVPTEIELYEAPGMFHCIGLGRPQITKLHVYSVNTVAPTPCSDRQLLPPKTLYTRSPIPTSPLQSTRTLQVPGQSS